MTPGKALKTNGFSQFVALLYKQLLLRKFYSFATTFEIIIPIIIASIPCMLYSGATSFVTQKREEFKWVNFTTFYHIDPMNDYSYVTTDNVEFVYAPSNGVTDQFMKDSIRTFFSNRNFDKIPDPVKKNSEGELRDYIFNETKWDEQKLLIGTVFKGFGDALPADLDYKIYYTKRLNVHDKYGLNGPVTYNEYRYSFFLQWQTAVGNTFIHKKSDQLNKDIDYRIYLQMFPYPGHKFNPLGSYSRQDTETFIHLGLILFVVAIVKRIVEEKNDGTKELMVTVGITKFPYWASTFTTNFTPAFIIALVVSIIYKTANKSTAFHMQTDFLILFIILLLLMANLILFCMAFSIFFNRVAYAVCALMSVYILSFPLMLWTIYYYQMYNSYAEYFSFSLFHKLVICIFPTGGLVTSFLIIHLFEGGNEGVQWRNLTEYPMVPDINMLMVTAMMVFSCFFYIVAIWYFDTVWPWQPGARKPFYFFFMRSYWFGEKSDVPCEIELTRNGNTDESFEEEPSRAVRSVVIKDLSKVIQRGSSSKLVLNNVSLKCYQGQITILLGHSEAGKTSIINILAGKELATKGFASVTGLDVSKNMTRIHFGVCPQHNTLHEELSVEQHLKIYAGVKGTSLGRLGYEAEQALNSLKLSSIKNVLVSYLTYSEKRKLSIAIALVGGSTVLLLDEPTHGMDAESKKHVWDALLAVKDSRTVIVSTQSFEEADTLGDRIAVMAGGEIQSCGTPAYLKQKLGVGYHLHVQKDVNFDGHALTSLIKMYVSSVTFENETHQGISFNLGAASELGDLFEELEKSKTKLGFISYGVSVSTLKDVLVTVSNMYHKKENIPTENTNTEMEDTTKDTFHPELHASLFNRFRALLLKQVLRSKRHWRYHLIQFAIPFILMLLCCCLIKAMRKSPYQPLKLDISDVYGATDGFYYNNDPSLSGLAETFKNVLESNDVSTKKVSEPTHHVLKYGKENLAKYFKRLVVGGTLDTFPDGVWNLTAWHNSAAVQSMPMSILMMQTALLRYVANTGSISLTVVPILSAKEKYDKEEIGIFSSTWISYFLPLTFTFLSLSFVLPSTHEKATKAKLLQLMSGTPPVIYWIATFLCDYLMYFIICISMLVPPAIFFPSTFFGAHLSAIGTLLFFFFLYGWASLPLGYIISIFIKRVNRGLSIFIIICLLFSVVYTSLIAGMIPFLVMKDFETLSKLNDAAWFFLLFPIHSATSGVLTNFQIAFNNAACDMFTPKDLTRCNLASAKKSSTFLKCCEDFCTEYNCHKTINHLSWKNKSFGNNGPVALYLGLEGIIFFAILFLLETRTGSACLDTIRLHLQGASDQMTRLILRAGTRHRGLGEGNVTGDPQLLQEEERIRNLTSTQQGSGGDALVVLGLKKRGVTFSGANSLTFGVNGDEHFGILGAKGCGKTSTFRMLTSDDLPSEGNAFIQSCSLRGEFRKFQSLLGYCPEVDPLIDGLTGREMLLLFGQLRGLSGYELRNRGDELIRSMELTNCADELTQFYSGGDKRKLSVALALIGSPPVILLDEPTSGVDLRSRGQIWKAVTRARQRTGAAVLLATQSAEESQALCNRLAIMVNGRFGCLGSTEQLKAKCGQGHALTFKISKEKTETVSALKDFMQESLKNATLKNEYQGKLQYHVTNPSMTVGHLFKFMLDTKAQFELEDFSIGIVSLE